MVSDLADPVVIQSERRSGSHRNILHDRGYVDGEYEEWLSKQGWRMHIQSKQGKAYLCHWSGNHRIAKTGARVDTYLPAWQNWAARASARSAWRAELQLNGTVAAYNLQRLV